MKQRGYDSAHAEEQNSLQENHLKDMCQKMEGIAGKLKRKENISREDSEWLVRMIS